MGHVTATKPRSRRRSLGVRGIAYEGMDAETLICEAVHRFEHIENVLDIDWQPDAATCQRVGWHLVSQTGSAFRIGHRLLKLSSPSCPLMPPPEFRLCREIEPTADEMFDAGWMQDWQLLLWQSGDVPAQWQVGGMLYSRDGVGRRWLRLLYLHRDKAMARTDDGWIRLGRRLHR